MNLREYHSDDEVFQQSGITLMHLRLAAGSLAPADLISALKMLGEAIEELRLGGFCFHSDVYPNIVKTLHELDCEAVRKAVLP